MRELCPDFAYERLVKSDDRFNTISVTGLREDNLDLSGIESEPVNMDDSGFGTMATARGALLWNQTVRILNKDKTFEMYAAVTKAMTGKNFKYAQMEIENPEFEIYTRINGDGQEKVIEG